MSWFTEAELVHTYAKDHRAGSRTATRFHQIVIGHRIIDEANSAWTLEYASKSREFSLLAEQPDSNW